MADHQDLIIRIVLSFGLLLLGASSFHQSAGVPLPQEIALCGLGTIFIVSGGAYLLKWLWKR